MIFFPTRLWTAPENAETTPAQPLLQSNIDYQTCQTLFSMSNLWMPDSLTTNSERSFCSLYLGGEILWIPVKMLPTSSILKNSRCSTLGSVGEFLSSGQGMTETKTRWPGLVEITVSGLAFICTFMGRPAPLMESVKHKAASFSCTT